MDGGGAGRHRTRSEELARAPSQRFAAGAQGQLVDSHEGKVFRDLVSGDARAQEVAQFRFRDVGDDQGADLLAPVRVRTAEDDGGLELVDRRGDLILTGGVNVYPAEVDAALLEHPAVADAATIGVPSTEWGEEVKAVIELKPGVAPTAALGNELIAHCRERLARFKCPRTVDFVDALPRQDNGKIYKGLLRERYREEAKT